MLITKAGHTFASPINGTVIDVGCLGFDFSNEAVLHGADRVIAFDLGRCKSDNEKISFYQAAVSGRDGFVKYNTHEKRNSWNVSRNGVKSAVSFSISSIARHHSLSRVSLLKLDCEGAEVEILKSLPGWLEIDQISVEFHLHRWPLTEHEVDSVVDRIASSYDVVSHEKTQRNAQESPNYWDSLFVRKGYSYTI